MKFKYFKADHTTTIEDAKKQYYKLVMQYHPDRPNGDLEAMKAVNTKQFKDDLKDMGMRWASKKRRWYKAPKDWKRKHHREFTMDEIRGRYGSTAVPTSQYAALTA